MTKMIELSASELNRVNGGEGSVGIDAQTGEVVIFDGCGNEVARFSVDWSNILP